ncbi:MAG: hypothetical protein ACREJB_09855, partial [Planctomycetaceae bacterium]
MPADGIATGLITACLWSFVRGIAIVLAFWLLGPQLRALLVSLRGNRRRWGWIAALTPFFVPELIVGYVWRDASLELIHHP